MRTDIDGQVVWKGDYAPFGETLEGQPVTWGSQYKFLGNEDDGGLMDFGARFYDPLVGRFTSPDPIMNVSSANAVNPYVYCANNPLRYKDKFGLRAAQGPILKGGDEIGGGSGGGYTTSPGGPEDMWGDMGLDMFDPVWHGALMGGSGYKNNPGGQAGGRNARYAATHLLPRLALWAGVGVFVCAPTPDFGDEVNERII